MNMFPLDQIKAGYLLVIRDCVTDKLHRVIVNYNIHDALGYSGDGIWDSINSFNANLEIKTGDCKKVLYCIESVYGRAYNCRLLSDKTTNRSLLWKREPDAKKMTIDEIEKILGYPIEVISKEIKNE